jgi:hypothetical protein
MDVPVDKIVATYVKIRDKKEEIYREYKSKTAELEEQMATLKYKLLELSKQTGATSFSTPDYVAYRTVKNRYWTNDWESFYRFMHDNNVMEVLEKRIHQTNMKEFIDQNPDIHPPGLNIDSEYEFTIKRK